MATQVLDRTTKILDVLSVHSSGLALSDIARRVEVPHPTVYRLLQDLVRSRLVLRLPDGRSYTLGRKVYEFGLAARSQHDVSALFQPALETLSKLTGYPAYLFVRSGHDAVCYERTGGLPNSQARMISTGGRRPLGVGGAGLALLAAQEDHEVELTLRAHAGNYGRFAGLSAARVRALVDETRALGYSRSGGCMHSRTAAVGYALRDCRGQALTSVSLSTPMPSLRATEAERLGELIREQVRPLAARLPTQWLLDEVAA